MSSYQASFPCADYVGVLPSLSALTFVSTRLAIAQMLVVFSFVWPFFNYDLVVPGNTMEVNFLPVFVAALLVPEVTLREGWSLVLAMPVFAVALIWANPTAPLRLAIGIVPLYFVLNLTRYLRERGRELIPPNLAYRSLQVFVGFCVAQAVQFQLFPVIPAWLTTALMNIVPRYSGTPYDEFGIRGVQGWASEPAGAALMCIAFALVAIYQRPDKRWSVLALLTLLLLLNKSVYCLVLTVPVGLYCISSMRRKLHSLFAIVPMTVAFALYVGASERLADFHSSVLTDGLNSESNRELMRFAQILTPFQQFPHIYTPPVVFDSMVAEPMGLLPLVVGYGSVLGVVWLVYVLWRNFPRRQVRLRPLMLVAAFALLIMAPPDLIPSVVALAVFLAPRNQQAASVGVSTER